MAAHRYWRVEFKVSAASVPTGADEIEMRETVGGADVTSSGFASAQSQNGPNGPANAFSNGGGFWASDGSDAAGAWVWIQQDFGAGNEKDIVEIQVQTDEITAIDVEGVRISYSDNGTDFTITDTYDTPQADNTTQQYLVTDSGGGGETTPAFANQHGVIDVANTGGTAAISDVGSLDHTVVLNNNSRFIGAGPNGSSVNLPVDEASLAIRLTDTDEISFEREAAALLNNRASWTAWTSILPSGPNGFVVRERRTVTLNGSDSFSFTPAGIVDADKIIPFITGVRHDETDNGHENLNACAEINRTTGEVTVRGRGGEGIATIEITAVEFTGSNWSVSYGTGVSSADTGTITISSGVADWANALIFHQFWKGTGNNGAISDVTSTYEPGSNTTSVDWEFNANHDGNADQTHVIYALHNAGMNVSRFSSTDSSAGAVDIDITSAGLTDLAEALIVVSSNSSGGGTAHGRGTRNAQFDTLINAQHEAHRSGNTMQIRLQVAELPQDPVSTGLTVKVREGGVWVTAVPKVREGGVWVTAVPKVASGGIFS